MDTNPIYDSSNQPTTATVGTNTEASLSGLPLGKSAGGEVYLKTSPATLAGAARTISCSTVTGDGSVASGKKWIQFIFSTDFAGTLAGVAFSGTTDVAQEYPILPAGDTYAALTYTISAGSARLSTLV